MKETILPNVHKPAYAANLPMSITVCNSHTQVLSIQNFD